MYQANLSPLDHSVDQGCLRRARLPFSRHAAGDRTRAQRGAAGVPEFFVTAPAGSLFADNAQRAGKARCLQSPPQLGADPASRIPLGLEPERPSIERTLAIPKCVMAPAAQDFTDRLARNASRACHGLIGTPCPARSTICRSSASRLGAIPLETFGTGQGRGIDRPRGCKRPVQTGHLGTDCGQEGRRRIFEQMPAVCYLPGLGDGRSDAIDPTEMNAPPATRRCEWATSAAWTVPK